MGYREKIIGSMAARGGLSALAIHALVFLTAMSLLPSRLFSSTASQHYESFAPEIRTLVPDVMNEDSSTMKQIILSVQNMDRELLKSADVTATSEHEGAVIRARYHEELQGFLLQAPEIDGLHVVISLQGYQDKHLVINPWCFKDRYVVIPLARLSESQYSNGCSTMPFQPDDKVICLVLKSADPMQVETFLKTADNLGLIRDSLYTMNVDPLKIVSPGAESLIDQGIFFLRKKNGDAFERTASPELKALRAERLVQFAGIAVYADGKNCLAFDHQIIVKPLVEMTRENLAKALVAAGVAGTLSEYVSGFWLIALDSGTGLGAADAAQKLANSGVFASVANHTFAPVNPVSH